MSNSFSNLVVPPKPLRRPGAAADIATGIWLSRTYGRAISPVDVTRALTAANVRHVIVGTHAVNAYSGRPRSTADVDIIVRAPKVAAKVIAAAFPQLFVQHRPEGVRFADEKLEAIDLLDPTASKLFRKLLTKPRNVRMRRTLLFIPTLEGVLASKFHAMHLSQRGNAERMLDAADFMHVVVANARVDLNMLGRLADLIAIGQEERILNAVANARADRRLEF